MFVCSFVDHPGYGVLLAVPRFAVNAMVIFKVIENPAVAIHDEQLLALLLKLAKIAIVHILLVFETSQQLSMPPCRRRSLTRGFLGLDTLLHLTASMILVSVDYEPIKLKLLLVARIGMV
jgi:hypothetical protein